MRQFWFRDKQESWLRIVTRCATRIRKRFRVPDQATEDRIVRVFRAALRRSKRVGRKQEAGDRLRGPH